MKRHGVELRVIKHRDGRIMREDMEKAVDENTRLVVINRTSVGSGFTYDVKLVCEIAHEKGTYVLDDAVQTIGSRWLTSTTMTWISWSLAATSGSAVHLRRGSCT